MKNHSLALALTLFAVSSIAQAQYYDQATKLKDCHLEPFNKSTWLQCSTSSQNELKFGIQQYLLNADHDLYTHTQNAPAHHCIVQHNIEDFKIVLHPSDFSSAYYVQGQDLKVLNANGYSDGNCTKYVTPTIFKNIAYTEKKNADGSYTKKFAYDVSKAGDITHVARDTGDHFQVWGTGLNTGKIVYKSSNVADYALNANFNVKTKPLYQYILFTYGTDRKVTKVLAKLSGKTWTYTNEKDETVYKTFQDFKTKYKL